MLGQDKKIGYKDRLDFDHPLLKPIPSFLDMLLRAHRLRFRQEKPFILLVAEKDTLDKVPENINVVKYLKRMEGVKAALKKAIRFVSHHKGLTISDG